MNMMYTINASLSVAVVSANAASFSKQKVRTTKNRFQLLKLHTI